MTDSHDAFRIATGDIFDISGAIDRELDDLLFPEPEFPEQARVAGSSQNGTLTDRTNRAAINGRIPDVIGRVVSVPNIVMRPYRRFTENQEFEIGYYCASRNRVDITDLRDGGTLLSSLTGASAEIYAPDTSPKSGSPIETIGGAITDDIYTVYGAPELKNQELLAPNEADIRIDKADYTVNNTGKVTSTGSSSPNFSQTFDIGDMVDVSGIVVSGTRYDGTFECTAVDADTLTLDAASWAAMASGENSSNEDGVFGPDDGQEYVSTDWVEFTQEKFNRVWINVEAPNGIYYQKNAGVFVSSVNLRLQVQTLDDDNNPSGTITNVTETLSGKTKDYQGVTIEHVFGAATKFRMRAARTNDVDFDLEGTTQDSTRLKEVFAAVDIDSGTDFGNVTTILTRRESSKKSGSSAELTCIATEMLYKYESGAFAGTLTANTDAMQSFIRIAIDAHIGRLDQSELDLDQISGVTGEIDSYFSVSASSASLTLDNLSERPEAILTKICDAVNCTPYRDKNGKIKVDFEKADATPKRLFTHRSKAGAEKWVRSSLADGQQSDGVEIKYLDIENQKFETYQIPTDGSAQNPKVLAVSGIDGLEAAEIRATRAWNKIQYSKIACEFNTFGEGRLLKRGEVIEVVKGSRINTYDGYIVSQDGTTINLSNDVVFTDGETHVMRIKLRDGSLVSINCTEGANSKQVILSTLPSEGLYTGNSAEKTEFSFGTDSRHLSQLMIVQESTRLEQTVTIKAINYDSSYYAGDGLVAGSAFDDGFDEGFS